MVDLHRPRWKPRPGRPRVTRGELPLYLAADRVGGILHRLPVVLQRVLLPERIPVKLGLGPAGRVGQPDHDIGVIDRWAHSPHRPNNRWTSSLPYDVTSASMCHRSPGGSGSGAGTGPRNGCTDLAQSS
jgi:hypothetical protein